jgi:hypothetical protein
MVHAKVRLAHFKTPGTILHILDWGQSDSQIPTLWLTTLQT